MQEEYSRPVSCGWCGRTVDEVPVTWTVQSDERGVSYLCGRCTRDNVRKIEGSLPTEYW
jgi:DNA-directed RNA polymerase subunit RPC12/RpoP